MPGAGRALVVGVNLCPADTGIHPLKYAEMDAEAVFALLTDPVTGAFDRSGSTLLTGADATSREIKRALRRLARETRQEDCLLFYFAGHGLAPGWSPSGEAYLAASDLNRAELQDDPDAGIRTGFLRRDVFEQVAGTSLLVLDCCQTEDHDLRRTWRRPGQRSASLLELAFHDARPTRTDRHGALLWCPKDATAREDDGVGHGALTYELLRGLRGAAAGTSGEVSLESLAGYLGGGQIDPPVGRLVQAGGSSVVLARPTPATDGLAHPDGQQVLSTADLASPLDHCVAGIEQLLTGLFSHDVEELTGLTDVHAANRLRRLCLATGSYSGTILDVSQRGVRPVLWTSKERSDAVASTLTGIASPLSGAAPARPGAATGADRSLGRIVTLADRSRLLLVPLQQRGERQTVLALADPPPHLDHLGEALAVLLRGFQNPEPLHSSDPAALQLGVLTGLRNSFGRLPYRLYEKAFGLYRNALFSLVMVFEPVVRLSANPDMLGITSWEALARERETDTAAPGPLLDVAEAWGNRFVIERDCILASKALTGYSLAHVTGPWKGEAPKPVSINVAVRSILSNAYIDTLRESIRESHLGRQVVTLEISEKDSISPPAGEIWLPNPMEFFRERLANVARDLSVNFAVDDFGVGHASLDRLSSLTLTQIKIDRSILMHRLGLQELRLVVEVANDVFNRRHAHSSRPIVLEGVDAECPIPLRDIFTVGIQFVQGYIVESAASSQLRSLDATVQKKIAALVTERA